MSSSLRSLVVMVGILICLSMVHPCVAADDTATTLLVQELRISVRWITPGMSTSSPNRNTSSADVLIKDAESFFAGKWSAARAVVATIVDIESTRVHEQAVVIEAPNPRLAENGGKNLNMVAMVLPASPHSSGTRNIIVVPNTRSVSVLFIFEAPSTDASSAKLNIGTIRDAINANLSVQLTIPQIVKNLIDSYVERAKGEMLVEKGELDSALKSYNRAIELYPTNPIFYINRGFVYMNLGGFQRAIDDYTQSANLLDKSPVPMPEYLETAYFDLGNAEASASDDDKAISAYRKSASSNKRAVRGLLRIVDILIERRQLVEARNTVLEAQTRDPNNAEVKSTAEYVRNQCQAAADSYLQQGREYSDRGLFEDAIKLGRKAVELVPDDYLAHYRLSRFYSEGRYLDLSLQEMKTAVRLAPRSADMHSELAMAYEAKDDYVHAKEEFQKAVRLSPTNGLVRYNYGVFLHTIGDYAGAAREYQMAREYRPDLAERVDRLIAEAGKHQPPR